MPIAWFRRGVFLLCAALPSVAAADDYVIKFDRPKKVGDRYQVTIKGTRTQDSLSSAGGRMLPEKRESLAAELTADLEVLALSPKGADQKIRLTSTRLTFRSDEGSTDVFPNGTEVTVELVDGKSRYLVGGKPANELARKALELVIRFSADESSDDMIFGTEQRQRVGDRWRLNADAAAASLTAIVGSKIAPRDIAGGCEIKEVVTTERDPALRIEGEVSIANLKVPLPEGLAVRRGGARAKLSGLFPVDVRKGLLQQSTAVDVEVEVEGEKDGVKIRIATKSLETKEVRFTYR